MAQLDRFPILGILGGHTKRKGDQIVIQVADALAKGVGTIMRVVKRKDQFRKAVGTTGSSCVINPVGGSLVWGNKHFLSSHIIAN